MGDILKTSKLVGLNTKWYRYQAGITQEVLSELTNYKIAFISIIESGNSNITCNTIDEVAKALQVHPSQLLDVNTAHEALKLPPRVDMYEKN